MINDDLQQWQPYVAPQYYPEEQKSFAENQVATVGEQTFGAQSQYSSFVNLNQQSDAYHAEATHAYIEEKYEAMKQSELAKIDARILITRSSKQAKKQKVETQFADSAFRVQAIKTIKAPFGSDDVGRGEKIDKLRDSIYLAEQSHQRDMAISSGTIYTHPKSKVLIENNDFISTLRMGDSQEIAAKNQEMADKLTSDDPSANMEYTLDLCQRVVNLDLSVLKYESLDKQIANQNQLQKLFQFGLSAESLLRKVAALPTDGASRKLLARAKVVAEYICKMSTVNRLSNELEMRGMQGYTDPKLKKEIAKRESMGDSVRQLKDFAKLGLVAGSPDYSKYINKDTSFEEELERLSQVGGMTAKITAELSIYGPETIARVIKQQFIDKSTESAESIKAVSGVLLDKLDLLPKKLVAQFIAKYRTNKALDYKLAQAVAQSRTAAAQAVTGMSYMEKHPGTEYARTFGQWARPVALDDSGHPADLQAEQNIQYNIGMSNAYRDRDKKPDALQPYVNDFVQRALAVQLDENMFSMENIKTNLTQLRQSLQIATNLSDFFKFKLDKHISNEQREKLKKTVAMCAHMSSLLSSRVASLGLDSTTYAITSPQAWKDSLNNKPEEFPDFTVEAIEKTFKDKLRQQQKK